MSCPAEELKAYELGELAQPDRAAVESHVRVCEHCREELERLHLTHTALMTLEDEEIPRRIGFVSDQVFEPRWWQTIWRSGPAMGFASAALLAGAILMHAFAHPGAGASPSTASVDARQVEQLVAREVSARVNAAVTQAVSESEARRSREFARVLDAAEKRFESRSRSEFAAFQQAFDYSERQRKNLQLMAARNEREVGQ